MPATDALPVHRDRLTAHEGFRSLTSRERGAYLLSLCLLTNPDPDSPLYGCLCTGALPMTLEEWGREVGESNRAPATRLWKRLFEQNLLEWHHHEGRPYPRLTVCAPESTPPTESTPSTGSPAFSSSPAPAAPPRSAESPAQFSPLTRSRATELAQTFVRLSGFGTSLTDWFDRVQALGRTPKGVGALRAVLAEVERTLGSCRPPKDPAALLDARLTEACRAQNVSP